MPRTLCIAALLALAPLSAGAQNKHVLVLMCRDLGVRIGPYSQLLKEESVALTPAIDRIAAEGVVFDNAFCQFPDGEPSRRSLLSGLYPESTGALRRGDLMTETHSNAPSLARTLKEAGYWTGSAGRVYPRSIEDGDRVNWDAVVRLPSRELPIVRAARDRFVREHGPFDRPGARVLWRRTIAELAPQTRGQATPGYGPSGLDDLGHSDGRNAEEVIEWIQSRRWGDQPFFIALGFEKPHVPFVAPKQYFDLYDPMSLRWPAPKVRDDDPAATFAISRRYKAFGFDYGVADDQLQRTYLHAYLACVSYIDRQIARVLEALDELGLREDTLLVFVSDNGVLLGEHALWGKNMLVERCVNVPLIVSAPDSQRRGERASGIVELIDVFPSVCEWCGVAPPAAVQGQSFATAWSDPQSESRPDAYTVALRAPGVARSIRTKDWRYTEWNGAKVGELIDCRRGAEGVQNLRDAPQYAETVKRLQDRLSLAAIRAKPSNPLTHRAPRRAENETPNF